MKIKHVLFLFILFIAIRNYGQSTISYSLILIPPTCAACCDGTVCFTYPTGGCSSVEYFHTPPWASMGSCENFFCYNTSYTVGVGDLCDTVYQTFSFPPYTSISESNNLSVRKIYPNPATDILHILKSDSKLEPTRLQVTNAYGQVIYREEEIQSDTEIDLRMFSKGVYFVSLTACNKKISYKIVKE